MAYKNTFELISKDIQDIEKLVANFQNYSRIPDIELDLALSKLRNVYDILLMFRENTEPLKKKEENLPDNQTVRDTPEIQRPDPEPVREQSEPSNTKQITDKEADKPAVSDEKTTLPAENKKESISTTQPQKEKERQEKILAEKFKREQGYINEKIGANSTKADLSSRLNTSPIKSIAGSIGINDKFFFIRELFAGDAEAFRQTMNTLDQAENFNDAYNHLMNTYGWDMDGEAVQQLLNLIRRKFIPQGNE